MVGDEAFAGRRSFYRLVDAVQEVYGCDVHGADRIPYISFETNVTMAGRQRAAMANLREVHELCRAHGILVILDATRALENACFIQQREAGYEHRSIASIMREMCSYSDGATVSSKKDNLVNIGGFVALRDPETGQHRCPKLELVRLAIPAAFTPRRTWTWWQNRRLRSMMNGTRLAGCASPTNRTSCGSSRRGSNPPRPEPDRNGRTQ